MSVCCLIEIDSHVIRGWREGHTTEIPLRRGEDGVLTAECRSALVAELRRFLPASLLGPRPTVLCAVSSRGLALRRFTVPKCPSEQRRRLLALRIESEFPLAPTELAWGATALNSSTPKDSANGDTEEVLVAAVKKEALREFEEILQACGASPIFTPAAVARVALCPRIPGASAILEIGKTHTELLVLNNGSPASLRILNWGGTTDLQQAGAITENDFNTAVQRLAAMLPNSDAPQKLWVGGLARDQVATTLARLLDRPCEALAKFDSKPSTALAGMLRAAETNTALLELKTDAVVEAQQKEGPPTAITKWAATAGVLLAAALLVPQMEAWIMKPRLEKTLAAVKADRGRLKQIDDELDFLRHLKQNQPSYIDALYLISRSAPPGTRFDSLSLTKQGLISLKASMRDGNQVAEFRARLLETGLFSNLALEEQTPSPDRQKLTIRVSGQWKPNAARELATAAAAKEPDPPRATPGGSGGFPGGTPAPMPMPITMGLPPGMEASMPPGVTMPMPSSGPPSGAEPARRSAFSLPPPTVPGGAVPLSTPAVSSTPGRPTTAGPTPVQVAP